MNSIPVSTEVDLESLTGERADLLNLLLERKARSADEIQRHDRIGGGSPSRLPASWAQERLWFIDQLERGSTAYNIPVVARLYGDLDTTALRRALDDLMHRHEVLRTTLVEEDGSPKQEIAPERSFDLKAADLSHYDLARREREVASQRVEEADAEFDLQTGPLIRGRLLRLSATEHVLMITVHHVAADGWSLGVLLKELGQLYTARVERRHDPLPALSIQYADYAIWQRERFRGVLLEEELAYWRSHLLGAPPQLELPTDRQRPAKQRYRGGNVAISLDPQLTADLKDLARRHGLTLFMALYAGWTLLLSRLSGQEDLVVGTPVANRQRTEVEGLIGFFVNTLAIRVGIRPEAPLREFLSHVRQATLEAYNHQDVPFERIVADLQPERSLSRNPIFQIMFALQNAPSGALQMRGLDVVLEEGQDEPAIFDLFMSLEERAGGVVGSLNFSTDLFDRSTMERWVEYFGLLLREMAHRDLDCIADLSILPRVERGQVLGSFNTTGEIYRKESLIHELFEEQVARAPDAIAAEHEGQSVTYGELNRRANQLARHLLSEGVGPDQ
ncbi:MAG TPA: condensation domain-containing protein, partial [Steroidobacteraceae bacterium]|nr:condensation domain-containing protein [Steroidobacteraceae bacterium]